MKGSTIYTIIGFGVGFVRHFLIGKTQFWPPCGANWQMLPLCGFYKWGFGVWTWNHSSYLYSDGRVELWRPEWYQYYVCILCSSQASWVWMMTRLFPWKQFYGAVKNWGPGFVDAVEETGAGVANTGPSTTLVLWVYKPQCTRSQGSLRHAKSLCACGLATIDVYTYVHVFILLMYMWRAPHCLFLASYTLSVLARGTTSCWCPCLSHLCLCLILSPIVFHSCTTCTSMWTDACVAYQDSRGSVHS